MMPRRVSDFGGNDERPLGELFSDMSSKMQDLLRKEVELAKIETKDQVTKAGKAGALFGAAGVTGFVALLLCAFAAAWGLAEAIPVGMGFLAVGLLFGVVAAVLALQGKKRIETFEPVPERTIRTLRDDVKVAKDAFSRGASDPSPRSIPRSWNA